MLDFRKIYVSWRSGKGGRRYLVGLLEYIAPDQYTFKYDKEVVERATKEGFTPYVELPDIEKVYDEYALQVFSQRLMKPERPDIQQFYDFWEIDPAFEQNPFYLLGHTQGLLPTDNFEFLADYQYHLQLHFLTELASTSHNILPAHLLNVGDELTMTKEPNNEHDPYAVKVFKDTQFIGYIKKVHNKIFNTTDADKLKLSVKAVDKNGVIKKLFIKVAQ